jgi:hypothetical protein
VTARRAVLLVALAAAGAAVATSASAGTGATSPGRTLLLAHRVQQSNCRVGALPDRRCSPGAYASGLTKGVICSQSFRTSAYRHVPLAEKHAVELEYGLPAKSYGSSLEIDHIVSLELGGSNDIANLYPERADAQPGYHVKDRLENKLHKLVCANLLDLTRARRAIASNWVHLYTKIYGVAPTD